MDQQHSPSILIRQTWEAPNITISHGSTYSDKDEGGAGGPNLARRFFFFRYRRFTHGGQMDLILIQIYEIEDVKMRCHRAPASIYYRCQSEMTVTDPTLKVQ